MNKVYLLLVIVLMGRSSITNAEIITSNKKICTFKCPYPALAKKIKRIWQNNWVKLGAVTATCATIYCLKSALFPVASVAACATIIPVEINNSNPVVQPEQNSRIDDDSKNNDDIKLENSNEQRDAIVLEGKELLPVQQEQIKEEVAQEPKKVLVPIENEDNGNIFARGTDIVSSEQKENSASVNEPNELLRSKIARFAEKFSKLIE